MSEEIDLHNESASTAGKRIAKNTLTLYTRTFVIMITTLITSRYVLKLLGDSDFGIYELVAGFVIFFDFLNFAMNRASMRFIVYERGAGNRHSMLEVFNISAIAHTVIAMIMILLGETVGLWFVNTCLNIPPDRMLATNVVYQLALISIFFVTIRTPYNATILAYERMQFYSYVSIFEALMRLGTVALLFISHGDRLILYSASWTTISILMFFIYRGYCKHHFESCRFCFMWNKAKFIEMVSFSGWSFIDGVGTIASQQGLSVILNIFFGTVVNAAVGMTNKVVQAIGNIINGFLQAFNPKLVALYADGNILGMQKLIISTSKISLFLVSLIVIPLYFNIDFVLYMWLGENIPPHTATFCRVAMIMEAVDALTGPLVMANQATGRIKGYSIMIATITISAVPIMFVCMKFGFPPVYAFWVRTVVNTIGDIASIMWLNRQIGLPVLRTIWSTLINPVLCFIIIIPIVAIVASHFSGLSRLLITTPVAFLLVIAVCYFVGLERNEKELVMSFFHKYKKLGK